MGRWRLSFGVGLSVWLALATAGAEQPGRVSVRWAAPEECPDDVQLVHAIERLIGETLSEAGEQTFAVRVLVDAAEAGGYVANISFHSGQGTEERFLEHPQCDRLMEAVALMIALAVDPNRVRETQARGSVAPVPPPLPREEPILPVPPQVIVPRATEPPTHESPRHSGGHDALRGFWIALHGAVGAGALPKVGGGAEAVLGWQRNWSRLDLVGRYWAPRTTTVSVAPSASIDLTLNTLGLRACWLPVTGVWSAAACAGGDVGDQSGAGSGVAKPTTKHALYADVAGGLQVAYRRWRLAPEAGFELSGAVARPAFGVTQGTQKVETFRPSALGFTAFFGLAFEL